VPTVSDGRLVVGRFGAPNEFVLRWGSVVWVKYLGELPDPSVWSIGWSHRNDRGNAFTYGLFLPATIGNGSKRFYVLPLWCVLVPSILVTAWLWGRDRRLSRPAGTKTVRRDRLPQRLATRIAAAAFVIGFCVTPFVLAGFLAIFSGGHF